MAEKQIFKCPDCNSVLGEVIDGIFIRTRAGELQTWGKDLHILLTCHNETATEKHKRMILIQKQDGEFEILPYEQYLKERIEEKRAN
jgi:hypothetical protein